MKRSQRTSRKSRFARKLFASSRAIDRESSPWTRGSVSIEPLERRNLLSADFGYVLPGAGFGQEGQSMATDVAGNVYMIGSNNTVAKYNSAGNLVWFTPFTETQTVSNPKNSIAIDPSGNLYISGSFAGTATFGSISLVSAGANNGPNGYVAKLNSSGNFVWAKSWLSGASSNSYAISVDSLGNVYAGGSFTTSVTPGGSTSFGAFGSTDAIIAKYDTSGNFLWAKQIGGTGADDLRGLGVDAQSNVYATGRFTGVADLDPSGAVYSQDGGPGGSAYVLKLDSSGNFRWADANGSINWGASAGAGLTVDSAGNVYATGSFAQSIFSDAAVDLDPTPNGVSIFHTNIFATDGYIQKLDANGNFLWARQLHAVGSNSVDPQSIAVDKSGNVYAAGIFEASVDFNSGGAQHILTSGGWDDGYLVEFDSRGNYLWSTSLGSDLFDGIAAVTVDNSNAIYLTGYFSDTVDFDPGSTTQFKTSFFEQSFLAKWTQASIGGQVFNDQNSNGLHDVAEQGLGGVAILLYQTDDVVIGNGDDKLVASAVTDAQGRYKFVGVASNTNFYVQVRTPVGFTGFSPKFIGGNPNLWSSANANGVTGVIPIIPLSSNVQNIGLLGTSPSFGFALAANAAAGSRPSSVATDASGNVYYAGVLSGTADFDHGAGTYNLSGANSAFVAKYSPAGALLWAEQIPVNSSQGITSIQVDARGNVYALGMFSGDVDFDPGAAIAAVPADAPFSPFILKLDENGGFVWAHELAAGTVRTAGGLALDSSDNVYTTGDFFGTVNFNPSGSPASLTSQGSYDAFIAKYDRYGTFVSVQQLGGAFDDAGKAIAVDKAGDVFVTGSFTSSATLTQDSTTYTLTGGGGGGTSFVLALDPTGAYLWSQAFQAQLASSGAAITVDAAGNVYSTGSFSGSGDFGGSNQLTGDVYLSKLDSTGNFEWAQAFDSDTAMQAAGIAIGPAGNVYLTGSFTGKVDFDPSIGLTELTSQNASSDPFVLKLLSNGAFASVATGGGLGADQSTAIVVDASSNVYTVGVVSGTGNFNPAGSPSFDVGAPGAKNAYLWKISPAPNVGPSFTPGPNVTVGEDTGLNTFPQWATNISAGPASESGQRLSFNVTTDNAALYTDAPSIDPSTGTLKFTLAPFAVGVANVNVQLVDSGGIDNGGVEASPVQTFTITVNFVNHAPTFVKGADQTANEGAGSRVVSGWATGISPGAGPNDVGQNLNFIVTTDNPALFDIQPAINAITGTLTYTLATFSSGVAHVSVQLHDDGGTANGGVDTSAVQTFTITVNFVNHAPSFTIGPNQVVNEDSGSISVAGWATNISPGPGGNEAGQALDFIVTNDNPSLFSVQPAVDASGKLTYTVAPNSDGIAHVSVKLHDDGGTANGGADVSATQNFTIIVNFVNEAPSFVAGPSQAHVENSGSIYIPGWATGITPGVGANESSQTLSFVLVADNPSLFLVQPSIDPLSGDLSYVLADNVSGATTVSVQLQDNGGTANGGVDTSPAQLFGITVTPVNRAPSFTAGPNVSALENSGPQAVADWATDISAGPPSEINQALNFTVTNDNPALFSVQPTIDAVTGTLNYTLAANMSGTANVTVQLHDTGGTLNGGVDVSAPETFTITSIFVNQAPSFLKGANESVLEGSGAHTVASWATNISPGNGNVDATQTLNFIVTNDNPGLFSVQPAVNPQTGALSYTLAPFVSGIANVSIQLHDNGGADNGGVDTSPLQTFTIGVAFVNQAPSFLAGSNQTLNEDAGSQTIAGWATNITPGQGAGEASQTVTFTVANDNAALFDAAPAIDPLTGTLTFTPAANANGTATVTVRLRDNGGTDNGGVDISAAQTFTISVNAVNDAPSFTAGPSQTVNQNTGPYTLNNWAANISAGPSDEQFLQTVDFIVTTDNPSLFSQQPSIDPFTGALSYKPATNASGVANVSVQLHDNGGTANGGVDTSAVQNFSITVNLINSAPSFVKGPDQTVNESSGAHSVANWATAISPGLGAAEAGQTLDFIVSNDNTALFSVQPAVDPTTGTLTYTLAPGASGVAHVSVRLHDNGGTANGGKDISATQTFAINVNFVNDPPSFAKGLDQNVNQDTGVHTVQAWATNISPGPGANEATQSLSFLVTNDSNSLFSVQPAISPSGALSYTLAPGAVGTAHVTVLLKDNGGTANGGVDTSAPQTFDINVNHVNHKPTVAAPLANRVMNEGGADLQVSLAGVFDDADIANFADALAYSLASNDNPGLVTASLNGDLLLLHLAPNQFGTAHLNVRATDTAFASVDDLLTLTVNPVNNAPAFIPGPGQLVNLNSWHVSVPNWATGITAGPANESNQALDFIVTNDNNLLFFVQPTISANGTLDYTLSPGAFGSAHVTVRLHDNGGTANGGVDSSAPITFLIQVKAPPVANSDVYVLSTFGANVSPDAGGVLANDSNPYGDPVTARIITAPSRGTVTLNPDGSFTFVKGANFVALDRFTYRIIDGSAASNSTTVTVMSYEASTIVKLYQQVLHRAPDDAGLTYWTNLVQNGQPYSAVAQGIFESNERLNPIIQQYFQAFLLRPADVQGLTYWRDQVWKRDGGPDNVIAGMISSPEFFQSAGGTNAGWVTALYQRLLNRTPDAQGLSYWVQALNSRQLTEQQVVLGFLKSDESFQNLITGFYQQYLGRSPSASELANYVAQMRAGATQRSVQLSLIASDEYRNSPAAPALGSMNRLS